MLDLGKKLQRARGKSGETLRALAARCKVSNAYLSQLETGGDDKALRLSWLVVQRLVTAYGVDLDQELRRIAKKRRLL
jgi:transcriptional regulator with XRE-family HTH domain